jgi:hypothetical protein
MDPVSIAENLRLNKIEFRISFTCAIIHGYKTLGFGFSAISTWTISC